MISDTPGRGGGGGGGSKKGKFLRTSFMDGPQSITLYILSRGRARALILTLFLYLDGPNKSSLKGM